LITWVVRTVQEKGLEQQLKTPETKKTQQQQQQSHGRKRKNNNKQLLNLEKNNNTNNNNNKEDQTYLLKNFELQNFMRRRNIHKIQTRRDPQKKTQKQIRNTHRDKSKNTLSHTVWNTVCDSLQTCFSDPSFSYFKTFSPNFQPPHPTATGTASKQVEDSLLIATHLDQSNYRAINPY
jgi:hypothetical protein